MSKRNTVKFELNPKNPAALTPAQRKRLASLAARPDSEIDYSDTPKQVAAVKWTRPGALESDESKQRSGIVDIDTAKIDEAVLALLCLGRHDGDRTWKSFDWDAMNRLHEKGYITNPLSKAKSVVFTEKGIQASEQAFRKLFSRSEGKEE